jgi:thiol-disulfide isomerase/thioredoxin
LAAEATPPIDSNQTALVVRLVDMDGKPVEGARVSTFAEFDDFSTKSKHFAPDESGWNYFSKVVSDRDGMARVTDGCEIDLVVARHIGKKLVAIQSVNPEEARKTVTVTMYPQCKVVGRLTSKELEARHRKFTWSNVYLFLNDEHKRPMSCQSEKGEFHFYVPPGTYKLEAYSTETHNVWKTITVKPGQETLEVDPMDMRPTRLTLLEGQPAPELQDIVAWKNGGPVKLSDLRGKVVLLEFWGHWCGPCVGGMPDLFSVYDKYRDKGLVVIGIHVDAGFGVDTVAKLDEKLVDVKKRLWKGRDIPFPVALVLRTNALKGKTRGKCLLTDDLYDITGYPTAILIDRTGRVVGQFYAGDKTSEATLEKKLSEK